MPEARATLTAEWDDFLRRSRGGDHVQSSGWGAVKRLSGLVPVYAIVRRQGRIVAGAQILTRALPLGGRFGYVPYGPVCEDTDPALVSAALSELRSSMTEHRIRALIVQPPEGGEYLAASLAAEGHVPFSLEVAPSATLRLSLEDDLEAGFRRLRETTRRNIRASQKAGVTFRELRADEVETFHNLHSASADRQGFTPMPLSLVQEQLDELGPAGEARIFVVELEGEAVGSVFVTCFGGTVTYKLPGFSPGGKVRPAEMLIWETILWAARAGYRSFDFGGVPRSYASDLVRGEEPGESAGRGAAEFKRGFRGEPLLFPQPYLVIPNPLLRRAIGRLARSPRAMHLGETVLNRIRRLSSAKEAQAS